MVGPQDLGVVGARLLQESVEHTSSHYVKGLGRYSSADVAASFGEALGKTVKVVETPLQGWVSHLRQTGFSPAAAESMAAMTAITLDQTYDLPDAPIRGTFSCRITFPPWSTPASNVLSAEAEGQLLPMKL
jgi:hypothetical protein